MNLADLELPPAFVQGHMTLTFHAASEQSVLLCAILPVLPISCFPLKPQTCPPIYNSSVPPRITKSAMPKSSTPKIGFLLRLQEFAQNRSSKSSLLQQSYTAIPSAEHPVSISPSASAHILVSMPNHNDGAALANIDKCSRSLSR